MEVGYTGNAAYSCGFAMQRGGATEQQITSAHERDDLAMMKNGIE